MCKELARISLGTGKPAANENLESMVIPTEFPIANPISQTGVEVQGNLLREYEQKFAELPEQQKLTKLCSNAGFSNNIEKGQFFLTIDDEAPDEMKGSMSRVHLTSKRGIVPRKRVDPWKHENRPNSGCEVWYHAGRYGVQIMIESLFPDRTVSWVRIVNGINKYVTETSEEIHITSVEKRGSRKPVAKAKPRPKPALILSPVSILTVNENG